MLRRHAQCLLHITALPIVRTHLVNAIRKPHILIDQLEYHHHLTYIRMHMPRQMVVRVGGESYATSLY